MNRGCVILKCVLIETTLPLLLGGIHLELQSYTGHSQSIEGRVYPKLRVYPKSSKIRLVPLKRHNQNLVDSFRISVDYRHASPSEYYYLCPHLPRTWSGLISMEVTMMIPVCYPLWFCEFRLTCTLTGGHKPLGRHGRDQRIRLTYWITRLDGRAGWRVWENNKGETATGEDSGGQERGSGNRGVTRHKEERKGRVGKSSAVATRDFNLQSPAPLCIIFCLIPASGSVRFCHSDRERSVMAAVWLDYSQSFTVLCCNPAFLRS